MDQLLRFRILAYALNAVVADTAVVGWGGGEFMGKTDLGVRAGH